MTKKILSSLVLGFVSGNFYCSAHDLNFKIVIILLWNSSIQSTHLLPNEALQTKEKLARSKAFLNGHVKLLSVTLHQIHIFMLVMIWFFRYYSIYDSGDRQPLLNAYHDGASLSITTPYSTQNPSRWDRQKSICQLTSHLFPLQVDIIVNFSSPHMESGAVWESTTRTAGTSRDSKTQVSLSIKLLKYLYP